MKIAFIILWMISLLAVTFPVSILWRKYISGPDGIGLCASLFISLVAILIAIVVAIWVTAIITAITMVVAAVSIILGFLALMFYRFKGWDVLVVGIYYASMIISIITFL